MKAWNEIKKYQKQSEMRGSWKAENSIYNFLNVPPCTVCIFFTLWCCKSSNTHQIYRRKGGNKSLDTIIYMNGLQIMNYFIAKQTHEAKTKHKYRVTLQVQFIILMKGLIILNNSRVCMENMHLISNIYFDFILFFLAPNCIVQKILPKKTASRASLPALGKLPSPNCTIYQGTGL